MIKRTHASLLSLFIICLLSPSTSHSRQAAGRVVVVKAARALDARAGAMISNAVIVIEGDRVKTIGANAAIPAEVEVIDLGSKTVLPGLIDCHTHLTFEPSQMGYSSLGVSVPRSALTGAKNARLTLEAGFTTVRNVGASGYADVALRDAINAGDVPGPRIVASGPALGITGGHCDNNLLAPEFNHFDEGVADGVPSVMRKTREVIKYGADVIKICSTGGVLSLGDDPKASQYTLEEMKAIVAEAHRLGRKVAAHAHGGDGNQLAVLAGELDAVAAVGLGRDFTTQAVGFGDDGLHLFERVLRGLRVVAEREHSAGRTDFDHVGAVLDHLARLSHHGRHPVGDAFVEVIEFRREQVVVAMPAGDAEGRSGGYDPRPRDVAGVDRVAQRDVGVAARADVAHSREAGFEREPRVLRAGQRRARH